MVWRYLVQQGLGHCSLQGGSSTHGIDQHQMYLLHCCATKYMVVLEVPVYI
jgi:hypothetical protein